MDSKRICISICIEVFSYLLRDMLGKNHNLWLGWIRTESHLWKRKSFICQYMEKMFSMWQHTINTFVLINARAHIADIHYSDVTMGKIASQITSLTIVYSIVYSDADKRGYQSSASLAFVQGIHRGPVNSPRKWSVTREMLPFDEVIMCWFIHVRCNSYWFSVELNIIIPDP